MNRAELASQIYKLSYLTGSFKLRSGTMASEYFDKYRFESQPAVLREIAKQMKVLIPADTQALAGLEMGGIPIATALSFETGLPVLFVRKTAKDYGTCQFAEGLDARGLKLCIVEDVITTGGQVILSTKDLRSLGAVVHDVVGVIQRNPNASQLLAKESLQLKALFQMEELLPKK